MPQSPKRYSETFKRQAVARMIASPHEVRSLARELNVSRTLLYKWRKQFSPSAGTERGPGGEVAVCAPGYDLATPPAPSFSPLHLGEGPGVRAELPGVRAELPGVRAELPGVRAELPGGEVAVRAPGDEVAVREPGDEVAVREPGVRATGDEGLLCQTLLNSALTLAAAVEEAAASAPLNQLTSALGLIIDRLLKLGALASPQSTSISQGVIQIEYLDPDGSVHRSPPWARGDPAFGEPISRGRVRSPFWED